MKEGFAIWLTGLPSSGKSTLARALADRLAERQIRVQILDSDELRRRLTPNPDYSHEERLWFYDTVGWLAAMLTGNGVNVLIAATAALQVYRDGARQRIERFAEVYVACSPQICRARDPKGLWQKAESGEISQLPGVNVPYEPPQMPQVTAQSDSYSIEELVEQILLQFEQAGFWSE